MDIGYSKAYENVKRELLSNDNFFSETFESIRKNNPYLAYFVSKTAVPAEDNAGIKTRTLWMSLIALKIAGATDKDNSDFIVISPEATERAEAGMAMLTDNSKESLGELRAGVSYLNSAYNAGGDEEVPFQNVWPEVKKCF
jgi:hypothetical protein